MEIRKIFIKSKILDKVYMNIIRPIAYLSIIYPTELFRILLIKLKIDKRYNYLKKYKNVHKNERAFIIGTGPSLTLENYRLLKDEITMGCNALCMWFDKEKYSTYFFCSDRFAYTRLEKMLPRNTFVTSYLARKANLYGKKNFQIVNNSRYNFFCKYNPKISDNFSIVSYDFNSVVFFAIQFAIYAGINEIYLLGVDCNYKNINIYSVDHGIRHKQEYMNDVGYTMIENFKSIKKYCDSHDIKIYNASKGGMLNVFERVDLNIVLKEGK